MTKKEYPISDDIMVLFYKHEAAKTLRDLAIKMPFGYKKALRAATDSIRFLDLFWKQIYQVYPELKSYRLKYDPERQVVSIADEKE